MIRRLALLALLVAGNLALAAEPALPVTQAPAAAAPFLWEVQGPKAKHFVLGSVHWLPPSAHPLPPALDAAYAATQVLVLEMDLEAFASPEVQGRLLSATREAEPGGLRARIGRSLYRKLQKRARALGMPEQEVCAELRAWFCAVTLEYYPLQQAGFAEKYGIDQHYFSLARDDGRPVVGLETPEFQVALFAQMSPTLEKQLLAATLDEATYESQAPDHLYRLWRTGDLDALEEGVVDTRKRYPELYARILADRNGTWAEPLAERMKAEVPMLVIVGAAHLPGPDGLLALLKARGLEAKPAPAPPAPVPPVSPG